MVKRVGRFSASKLEEPGKVRVSFNSASVVGVSENACVGVSNIKFDFDPGRSSFSRRVVRKFGGTKNGSREVFRVDDLLSSIRAPLTVNVLVVVVASSEIVHCNCLIV